MQWLPRHPEERSDEGASESARYTLSIFRSSGTRSDAKTLKFLRIKIISKKFLDSQQKIPQISLFIPKGGIVH
ncbi:hypothetical protein A2Y83_02020 [Candidatus Falkowbacteria bacterium RBG_13_39_14]|uniref:Uncharacterized protein n=1 Tax=Candidatus Falkowbacteria bacterium RBG_13_39_14 TaxID=1797985 RepID=A0A1F5S132_9BACT|nr:MAG: hypothetical protein A2Y83_02020 [Candidatus Falkowbacteria bacterium RBG_13_39_14]